MQDRIARLFRVLAVLAAASWGVGLARADLGPENLLLVVNGDSVASRTIANHYVAARGLSDVAVVTLHDLPDWETLNVEQFRERVLKPVLAAADDRALSPQLEAIAYSTAIPTKIAVGGDLKKDVFGDGPQPHKIFTPYGSLTGLTTLYEPVLQRRAAEYLAPNANLAFAGAEQGEDGTPAAPETAGFQRAIGFDADRKPTRGPGRRYLLSTVLGVTTGRGETVQEVVERLRATAAADGAHPAGAVIFCDTKDVRSTTRQPLFAAAVQGIEAAAAERGLDVRAEIVSTNLPRRERTLVGLTAGLAGVNPTAWTIADAGFAPGAFADNLTSFGAVLSEKVHGQVTAVDWLRFGAAASGGTVHEPYAVPFKFPSPFVHLHRLRGVTLAEAVVRSVAGPYQYLTVGDPLSNPYARRPVVTLGLRESDDYPLSGVVPVTLGAADPEGNPIPLAGWELFADGKRFATFRTGLPLEWHTGNLPNGPVALTAVAVGKDAAQSRGRQTRIGNVQNGKARVTARIAQEGQQVAWGEPLIVEVTAVGLETGSEGADAVIRRGTEEVGKVTWEPSDEAGNAQSGTAAFDTHPLGLGPVTLWAEVATAGDDGETETSVRSNLIRVTVVPPPNRAATVAEEVELLDGPALRWEAKATVPLADGLAAGWFGKVDPTPDAAFALSAVVTATEPGLHRLALRTNCGVTVTVDSAPAPAMTDATAASDAGQAWRSVPVWLEPGRHSILLRGRTPEETNPLLEVRWGREGLQTPTAAKWRRPADAAAD